MKSTITKLYDYTQAVIPAELLLWRVPDEEIAARLSTLSHDHAIEEEADEVQLGDCIACRGESASPRWNRAALLFFPGHNLCDASLENACIGAVLGEQRTAHTPEGEVILTVERILRRKDFPIGDELVQAEGIDGVTTVAEYYDWYRAGRRDADRTMAKYRAAAYLLKEIRAHSTLVLDQSEKDTWLWDRVNTVYNAMVEAGMDPTIPKEGFDFLTEEEAKAKMYQEHSIFFDDFVTQVYLVETLSGRNIDDVCDERLQVFAAEQGLSVEDIRRQSSLSMIQGKFAYEASLELLASYTEQFLEE